MTNKKYHLETLNNLLEKDFNLKIEEIAAYFEQ